jgi:hypothetical protein
LILKYEKIIINTNKLSILNDFSIKYQALNSNANSFPKVKYKNKLNKSASQIQTQLQIIASFTVISCAFLLKTHKSSTSINITKTINHNQ